jgi:hypothetical protein
MEFRYHRLLLYIHNTVLARSTDMQLSAQSPFRIHSISPLIADLPSVELLSVPDAEVFLAIAFAESAWRGMSERVTLRRE